MRKTLVILAVVFGCAGLVQADWIAYNDCFYVSGTDSNAANVTTFGVAIDSGTGNNNAGTSGTLLNQADGASTGATIAFTDTASVTGDFSDAAKAAAATDAYNTFAPGGSLIVDLQGQVRASSGSMTVTFSGLDSTKEYVVVTTSLKNDVGSTSRGTRYTLSGVDASTYAGSAGATKVSELAVKFLNDNETRGYVAKWTGIDPGDDGAFKIEATPDRFRVAPFGGVMLQEVPEPATLTLLGLGGLGLLIRRRRRRT